MPATTPQSAPIYNEIGKTYVQTRQADPVVVAALTKALHLDQAAADEEVIDVGAGTSNYTIALAKQGVRLTAMEPSEVMQAQARRNAETNDVAARIDFVRASVERMPFADGSFARLVCTLAMHHFPDTATAVAEMARVTKPGGRVAIFTADPRKKQPIWIDDYFGFLVANAKQVYAPIKEIEGHFAPHAAGPVEITPVLLTRDFKDLFFLSCWARPHMYLDRTVCEGISHFAKSMRHPTEAGRVEVELGRLRDDLESGAWQERYGAAIDAMKEYDGGYRVVSFTRG